MPVVDGFRQSLGQLRRLGFGQFIPNVSHGVCLEVLGSRNVGVELRQGRFREREFSFHVRSYFRRKPPLVVLDFLQRDRILRFEDKYFAKFMWDFGRA
jgi:hypothetical protein